MFEVLLVIKIAENTCRITEETTKTLPTCNHETGNTRLTFVAAISNEVLDIAANVIVGKFIYLFYCICIRSIANFSSIVVLPLLMISSLKSYSHLPKKIIICLKESSLKVMKNAFYFILKGFFFLKIFKFLL